MKGKRIPTDTAIAYLHRPKDALLKDGINLFLAHLPYKSGPYIPEEREAEGRKLVSILAEHGINTYEQLLNYEQFKRFSALPGMEPRYVEAIQKFISMSERGNKSALEREYYKTSFALSNLEQISKESSQARSAEGRKTALSM